LQLLPFHWDLNAVDLIWNLVKHKIAA
jgi:hypothetical protein